MVERRLQAVFRMVFGDESITLCDDTTADDIQGWDSVAHINLMFALEQEFGITFRHDEFAALSDVGQLRRRLEEKVAAA